MLNQWDHLTVFLGNPKVPLDNKASERALRVVARGRKPEQGLVPQGRAQISRSVQRTETEFTLWQLR